MVCVFVCVCANTTWHAIRRLSSRVRINRVAAINLAGTSFSEADLASLVKAWAYTCASVGATPTPVIPSKKSNNNDNMSARPPLAKKESGPLLASSVRDVPDVFDRAVLASLTSKRSEAALG